MESVSLNEFTKAYRKFQKVSKKLSDPVKIQQYNSINDQLDMLTFELQSLMDDTQTPDDTLRKNYIQERLYPMLCAAMITYSIHLGDEYDSLHSSSSTSTSTSSSTSTISSSTELVPSSSSSSSLNA